MTTPTNPRDTNTQILGEAEIIEKLATIEHERWANWQKWCHKVLRENNPSPEQGDILERWDRQIEAPYAELSEAEKQSDRDQVARYWPLIEEFLATEIQMARIDEVKKVEAESLSSDRSWKYLYRRLSELQSPPIDSEKNNE